MSESLPPGAPEAVLIDGQPAGQVSVRERALHYGDGLFETIACPGGTPRLLDLHLQRLARGGARLKFPALDAQLLAREVRGLAAASERCIIKLILSRGAAHARGYRPSGTETPSRILLRYGWPPYDSSLDRDGVSVRTATVRLGENPALAGIKHLNRLEQVLAAAESADVAEALMYSSSGELVSGIMSNVFLVDADALLTPALDCCGVLGVMRERVLTLAAAAGIPVLLRRLTQEDCLRVREMFLTNALIGVRPVRSLDGRALSVGALTRRVQELVAADLAGRAPC
jgi:4-amino-4-deoxychorismate lyase